MRINIVDTPGHADFGGEVERILNMVDSAIVLVDFGRGQCCRRPKFVVGRRSSPAAFTRLSWSIRSIVRTLGQDEVHTEVFDLFAALDRVGQPARFHHAVCLEAGTRWADATLEGPRVNLDALFDLVVSHVPPPTVDRDAPFAMVASILEYDNFLGRVLTGRIEQGSAKINMQVKKVHLRAATVDRRTRSAA